MATGAPRMLLSAVAIASRTDRSSVVTGLLREAATTKIRWNLDNISPCHKGSILSSQGVVTGGETGGQW